MSVFDPKTWADTEVIAEGDLNDEIRDRGRWLLGHPDGPKPYGSAILSASVPISGPTVYEPMILDGTGADAVDAAGNMLLGQWIALSNGFLDYSAFVRVDASLGNKELRLVVDGDDTDYFAADNRFGIATPAFCVLTVSGKKYLEIGQTADIGVFCDAAPGVSVIVARLSWAWQAIGVA